MSTVTFRIYGLYDPRTGELRYVGQTRKGLRERLGAHVKEAKKDRTHKAAWIRSVLADGHAPEIHLLQEFSTQLEADQAEVYWISFFGLAGRLTNLAAGGVFGGSGPKSLATREKISKANIGRKHSAEAIAKITAAVRARRYTPEQRKRMGASKVGKTRGPPSAEWRAKISASLKGRPHAPMSAEIRAKVSASKRAANQLRRLTQLAGNKNPTHPGA